MAADHGPFYAELDATAGAKAERDRLRRDLEQIVRLAHDVRWPPATDEEAG